MGQSWRDWIPEDRGEPFRLLEGPPPLPGLWDLRREPEVLEHWVPILSRNMEFLVSLVDRHGPPPARRRAREVQRLFGDLLEDLRRGPARERLPTIHHVTRVREALVQAFGLGDPYEAIKRSETEAALRWRPTPSGPPPEAEGDWNEALAVLVAGNLFDMGSALTQKAYRRGELDLAAARERFREEMRRRGVGEQLEAWLRRHRPAQRPGHCLFFVDNAGADFVLGVLALVGRLVAAGWEVTLAANATPASNDVTREEAEAILARLPGDHPAHAWRRAGRLRVCSTGTGTPGIDLRRVGPELNAVAARCDLVILEGQGRAVETTWNARLSVPVLRIAVLKDPLVARRIGRSLWDAVVDWRPPARAAQGDAGRRR
jgi:type II pantothenate kinase